MRPCFKSEFARPHRGIPDRCGDRKGRWRGSCDSRFLCLGRHQRPCGGSCGKRPVAPWGYPRAGLCGPRADPRTFDISLKLVFEVVVTGHLAAFAAFSCSRAQVRRLCTYTSPTRIWITAPTSAVESFPNFRLAKPAPRLSKPCGFTLHGRAVKAERIASRIRRMPLQSCVFIIDGSESALSSLVKNADCNFALFINSPWYWRNVES